MNKSLQFTLKSTQSKQTFLKLVLSLHFNVYGSLEIKLIWTNIQVALFFFKT